MFRYYKGNDCTLSYLLAKGRGFYILERPWLNNQSNISCIPDGDYIVKFLKRSSSGRYRDVWWVQDVKGRFGILIHKGNVVSHTKGCLIIGSRVGYLRKQKAVLASGVALVRFNRLMGKEDFMLNIRSAS
jgi:hypothetical protein